MPLSSRITRRETQRFKSLYWEDTAKDPRRRLFKAITAWHCSVSREETISHFQIAHVEPRYAASRHAWERSPLNCAATEFGGTGIGRVMPRRVYDDENNLIRNTKTQRSVVDALTKSRVTAALTGAYTCIYFSA